MFTIDEYQGNFVALRSITALFQRAMNKSYFELTLEEAFMIDAALLAWNRIRETESDTSQANSAL